MSTGRTNVPSRMIASPWRMLGGAGGVETVFTALSLYYDTIPPTINFENPGEECDLDYVSNASRKTNPRTVLSNSFGFGGHNACLVVRQFNGR